MSLGGLVRRREEASWGRVAMRGADGLCMSLWLFRGQEIPSFLSSRAPRRQVANPALGPWYEQRHAGMGGTYADPTTVRPSLASSNEALKAMPTPFATDVAPSDLAVTQFPVENPHPRPCFPLAPRTPLYVDTTQCPAMNQASENSGKTLRFLARATQDTKVSLNIFRFRQPHMQEGLQHMK